MMQYGGIVLLTCEYPPFPGGIGTYSGRLVDTVRAAGHKATVIAPRYSEFPEMPSDPDTQLVLKHHWISPIAAIRVAWILRRLPSDRLFLAADIRSVLLAYMLQPVHRRSYRAMIHGSEVSKFKSDSPLSRLVRRAYRSAEIIAANSEATLTIFSSNFGAPRRGLVTYLGVDPIWFEPAKGSFENAQLASLPTAAQVVCAVGRIEPRKGQLKTIKAIARAREMNGVEAPIFVIAGRAEDPSYAAEILHEARSLDVTILATGRISDDDLKRLYARSACHTLIAQELPGKIEGFGLTLLEAGAQGCPSVTTSVGGIPEVMGDTGVVTRPDSLDSMAQAITAFATDSALRDREGLRSRDRALSFSWRACAAATFPELVWPDAIMPAPRSSTCRS